jgi:hypothetical protein
MTAACDYVALSKANCFVTLLSVSPSGVLRFMRDFDMKSAVGDASESRAPIRVCRFNSDGKQLAVGYDTGAVSVSDLTLFASARVLLHPFICVSLRAPQTLSASELIQGRRGCEKKAKALRYR